MHPAIVLSRILSLSPDTLNGNDRNSLFSPSEAVNNLPTNQEEISYRAVEHQDSLNHILRSEHRAEIEVHFQINHQSHYVLAWKTQKSHHFFVKLKQHGQRWSGIENMAWEGRTLRGDEGIVGAIKGKEKKYLWSGRCIKLQILVYAGIAATFAA